jgi:hypothetical protein
MGNQKRAEVLPSLGLFLHLKMMRRLSDHDHHLAKYFIRTAPTLSKSNPIPAVIFLKIQDIQEPHDKLWDRRIPPTPKRTSSAICDQ